MKSRAVVLSFSLLILFAFKADKPAYKLFTGEGKQVKYEKMIQDVAAADVVFFGELHDNPIAHWLELEVTRSIHTIRGADLVLGAEMFESDNQLLIDEYTSSMYDASKFEAEVKLWKNYKTDYKPLVDLARENKLKFVATNIPRRYASMVSKGGFEVLDSISAEAKALIAPLPILYDPELKCYKDMMEMGGMGGHVTENFPKAQAVKDATMAHFILENLSSGKVLIHYNGSYHSKNHEGIIWYLNQARPGISIKTIEQVSQDTIDRVEVGNLEVADYIIVVPASMTKTYR